MLGAAVSLLIGTQLVGLGLLAELVTSYGNRAEDTYSVAETLGRERPRTLPEETPRDVA